MGDKMGRIHLGKQDLRELQTRKMKGLKRFRDTDAEAEDIIGNSDEDVDHGGAELKKMKMSEV